MCTTPENKDISYEVSYIIESTSNLVDKYTICLEKDCQKLMTCSMNLKDKCNETLLIQFENWFNTQITNK